jgi:hypothetical protein
MVVSTVLIQFDPASKYIAKDYFDSLENVEITEIYDDSSLGIYIEVDTSDQMMEVSKKITSEKFIKSFDLAYYNTELENQI